MFVTVELTTNGRVKSSVIVIECALIWNAQINVNSWDIMTDYSTPRDSLSTNQNA